MNETVTYSPHQSIVRLVQPFVPMTYHESLYNELLKCFWNVLLIMDVTLSSVLIALMTQLFLNSLISLCEKQKNSESGQARRIISFSSCTRKVRDGYPFTMTMSLHMAMIEPHVLSSSDQPFFLFDQVIDQE